MSEFLENLYREHRQGLYTFALSITGSPALAEDAIQNAFEAFYRRGIGQNANQGSIDWVPYVFRSVRNSAVDLCRSDQRQARICEVLFESFNSETFSEDALLTQERDELLKAAIDSLPESDREAVMLKIFGDLTFDQVGKVLETSPKTVATRYRRALGKLEEHLRGKI